MLRSNYLYKTIRISKAPFGKTSLYRIFKVDISQVEFLIESCWSFDCQLEKVFLNGKITNIFKNYFKLYE